MTSGWEKTKLGNVIQLVYGKPLPTEKRKPDGLHPVYGANGEIGRTDEFYYDQKSIIVGRKGSAGELNLTEDKFWPLDVTYFVTFDNKKYDLTFLFYLLSGLNLTSMARGVKPGINRNDVYAIDVSIPPLPEQQRIVAILDQALEKVGEAKNATKKKIIKSNELFTSYLQKVNGPMREIGDYVDITTGKLDANAATVDGKYSFFTCSRDVYKIDRFAFDCEAVLLAGNNAVGDFNVKHYKGKFNAYQRTYVITVKNETELSYRYLFYQLENSLKRFKERAVGAGTKFLKLGMIKELEIPIPDITQQTVISQKLDALRNTINKYQEICKNLISDLDELNRSLLQKAFNGEL